MIIFQMTGLKALSSCNLMADIFFCNVNGISCKWFWKRLKKGWEKYTRKKDEPILRDKGQRPKTKGVRTQKGNDDFSREKKSGKKDVIRHGLFYEGETRICIFLSGHLSREIFFFYRWCERFKTTERPLSQKGFFPVQTRFTRNAFYFQNIYRKF